jgi:hypothetical protein
VPPTGGTGLSESTELRGAPWRVRGGAGGRRSSRAQRGGFEATSRRWLVGTDRSYRPADPGFMTPGSKLGCHQSAVARRGLLGGAGFGGTTPDAASTDDQTGPGDVEGQALEGKRNPGEHRPGGSPLARVWVVARTDSRGEQSFEAGVPVAHLPSNGTFEGLVEVGRASASDTAG